MKTFATIFAALLTLTAASSGFACSLAEEGWFATADVIRAQPAGPYVVPLDNYYGYDTAPVATLEVSDASGEVVNGETEVIFGADRGAFLLWTPETALETDGSYTANLDIDQETEPGPSQLTIRPIEGLAGVTATILDLTGNEYATPATRECCETQNGCSFDTCGEEPSGGQNCDACWTTSWNYVIRPLIQLDLASIPTGRFKLEFAHVTESGDKTRLAERVATNDGPIQLAGASLDVGQDVPICVEVTATDVISGDSEVVVSECIEEADVERSSRDEELGTAPDSCLPNTFTQIDESGTETPIEGPGKTDEGCSAAGAGSASWLLLLVAGFVRRRRR